ncbi:MAG: LPXTG cell wall anchor domain-containing protein [Lachnospiraceae bacterium]|nr:LPXTG cell wall anchor domain-containing protein [Lachnospiraceae bacterium]
MPTNYGSYETYKLIFHDVMEDGLTFNSQSAVVTVYASTSDPTGTVAKAGYSVVTDCYHLVSISAFDGTTTYYTYDGSSYTAVQSGTAYDAEVSYYVKDDCTFEVVIADTNLLMDDNGNAIDVSASSIITVSFTATLNEAAVIGNPGNHNTMHIEYSNNPNWDGTGTEPTGETPEDTVVVFTYELTANKVKSDGSALSGAGFTLYKLDVNSVEYVAVTFYEAVTLTDSSAYDSGVSAGTTYYTYDSDDKVYIASSSYEDGETYYVVCTEMTGVTSFTWSGLDDGKYKLVETTTPTGYNTMDDLYFTVEATHTEDGITSLVIKDADGTTISGLGMEFSTTYSDGSISTNITNYTGSELPSTGGIGTTIFYAVGATLMVIAFVLLITKRRMRKYE